MISFLLASAGFLNLMFYVFAIGCAFSFVLEQFVKDNERSLYIVQTNRKYCWRQAWITNAFWFLCNIGLYIISRNIQTPSDTFWNGLWNIIYMMIKKDIKEDLILYMNLESFYVIGNMISVVTQICHVHLIISNISSGILR